MGPAIPNLMLGRRAVLMARHGKRIGKIFIKFIRKKMRFTKKGNIYRIIRLTGSQDNILGVSFGEDNKMEILEWPIEEGEKIRTSKKEVLEQIISGLESVNQSLGTNYKLSKIYFLPSDRASNSVYNLLIYKLIRHYHSGNEFKEV